MRRAHFRLTGSLLRRRPTVERPVTSVRREPPCPRLCSASTSRSRCATRRCPATTAGTPTSRPPHPLRPGSEFRVECREWTDAQLGNNDSANDVRDVEPERLPHAERADRDPGRGARRPAGRRHPRPRPRASRRRSTATRPGQGWGYTGIFAKVNGGGFLTDHFPDAYKAIWDFHGQDATSRHVPGVRYTGITHPGLFGTAPSADLLAEWNRREQALIDTEPGPRAAARAAAARGGRARRAR